MQHGPAVRRRKLGAELRALRARTGLTSGEAARLVGWHQSKVSRIETGTSGAKPADVRSLLDAYEVDDPQLREMMLLLAGADDGAGRDHWWHAYRGVLPPTYRDFISLESQAIAMRTLETTVVPGLLQTAEYAREVTRAAVEGVAEDRLDTLVEVRLARQDVLRADPPLVLSAVLDEAVLRREVGGPEVMARQLRRLVEAGRLPQVRLQVLPFAAGAHIGVTGPFVIFSFSNTSDLDVVVLDHLTSSLHLERKEDLEAYTEAFNALRIHALSPEDSLEYIAAIGDGA
ncbi:helix-turn-helix domain-containing protein [Streptomyces longwoodensis]|uniref:helix-turn-helix domain-containing protein n=1 Tax=Streptomyces longwoodensis TaxID=68231 RepID=UPI00224F0B23|nr:helix-turn-helix transcriptional regulator [Streptomyces longwoodensis]MCX4999611.1 helix-turn-helix domain-containing protein [Streptomyces longwoodensis]WTI48347.1 helix-turn-helix domain-containing protein [Streptomyces longwoodensis]